MGRAGAIHWRAWSLPDRATVRAAALAAALAAFGSLFVVAGGAWIRLLLALAVASLLGAVTLARPALGVIATISYLVAMALVRRVLIPVTGWIPGDPLLLVGPLVSAVLLVKLFVLERRRLAPDLVSKLVVVVLALTLAEVGNPAGGGLAAGLAGLLFMAVPLLWFFVGREVLSDEWVIRLMGLVVVLGTAVAAYGLWQTQVGDPPWDLSWLNVTGGYSSLNVGEQVRAFGTFSSSSEYALFVGAALVVSVALVLRGRLAAAAPIPLLAVALFLSSSRGALVTAAFAVVVVAALRTGRPLTALAVTACAVALAFGALRALGSSLSSAGAQSGDLISHEVGGITDPLNPDSSTLLVHLQLVRDGIRSGIRHPLGRGTAVTNGAAGVNQNSVNQDTQATEVDISNAFVALGAGGGIVYLLLVAAVLTRAVRAFFAGRRAMLPVIGLLVVGLGQWLIGGDYALSPLSWLLVGTVAAATPRPG